MAASDVAFELPAGTGKTAVGLVITEWQRLSGKKVAYLSLTNQLAGQVLAEAKRLGLPCANLRGTKDTRDSAEEGRYRIRTIEEMTELQLAIETTVSPIRLIDGIRTK